MVNPTSKQAFASMPPSPAINGKREGSRVVGESWVGGAGWRRARAQEKGSSRSQQQSQGELVCGWRLQRLWPGMGPRVTGVTGPSSQRPHREPNGTNGLLPLPCSRR